MHFSTCIFQQPWKKHISMLYQRENIAKALGGGSVRTCTTLPSCHPHPWTCGYPTAKIQPVGWDVQRSLAGDALASRRCWCSGCVRAACLGLQDSTGGEGAKNGQNCSGCCPPLAENGNAEVLAWLLFVLLGWIHAWIQDGLVLGHIAGCSLLWFLHKAFSTLHLTSAEEVRCTWVPKGLYKLFTQQEDWLTCYWENREPCAGINPCNLITPFISLFSKM